jgi:hypothetical protein
VRQDVTVPYTLEQDEDGVWCAHALLARGVGANGEGDTPEAAVEDLRDALTGPVDSFGASVTGARLGDRSATRPGHVGDRFAPRPGRVRDRFSPPSPSLR